MQIEREITTTVAYPPTDTHIQHCPAWSLSHSSTGHSLCLHTHEVVLLSAKFCAWHHINFCSRSWTCIAHTGFWPPSDINSFHYFCCCVAATGRGHQYNKLQTPIRWFCSSSLWLHEPSMTTCVCQLQSFEEGFWRGRSCINTIQSLHKWQWGKSVSRK